jgi:hypothetical protein
VSPRLPRFLLQNTALISRLFWAAYKEPAYAMNDLPPAPVAPYAHQRSLSNSPSVATMATGDLMTSEPMRSESAYDMGAYSRGGAASPYR